MELHVWIVCVGVCGCVCVGVGVRACTVSHSYVEQMVIRNVWTEETTQMIITAQTGSLKIEKNNRHRQYTYCLFYLFVIIKLVLNYKRQLNLINKLNDVSTYKISVKISDPHITFFFCRWSDSTDRLKDTCSKWWTDVH